MTKFKSQYINLGSSRQYVDDSYVNKAIKSWNDIKYLIICKFQRNKQIPFYTTQWVVKNWHEIKYTIDSLAV